MILLFAPFFRRLAGPLGALLLGAGCAVGPDYHRPTLPGQLASATVVPRPSAEVPRVAAAPWWQRSNDPTLARLVDQALANNRDLRGALARLQEARALRGESRSAFLPTGAVTAGYRRQLDSTVFFRGVPREIRDQDIFDVGVDSAWELDLFGRIRRTVEANTALAAASEADFAQLRLIVAAETARSCIALGAYQAMRTLREQQLAAAQDILHLLEQQVREGKIARDRIGRAAADVATLQTGLRELRLAERSAINRLAVLTGEGKLPAFTMGYLPDLPVPDLRADPVLVLERRPDVQAAERRLAASTAAIGIARADYFPTLSLVARVGAEANRMSQLDTADANTFAFGPRLSWDLLNLQRTRARVQGAEARTEQALATWENTVLLALEEIDNALARHDTALARRADWLRAVDAMADAGRIAYARQTEGRINPIDVRQTEQATLEARLELVRADAELANARVFLQQSLALE